MDCIHAPSIDRAVSFVPFSHCALRSFVCLCAQMRTCKWCRESRPPLPSRCRCPAPSFFFSSAVMPHLLSSSSASKHSPSVRAFFALSTPPIPPPSCARPPPVNRRVACSVRGPRLRGGQGGGGGSNNPLNTPLPLLPKASTCDASSKPKPKPKPQSGPPAEPHCTPPPQPRSCRGGAPNAQQHVLAPTLHTHTTKNAADLHA